MAEIATIARPYAEALFKSGDREAAPALAAEVRALAQVAANPQLRQYADDPNVAADAVVRLMSSIVERQAPLSPSARNLLATVVENGRLAALPAIADQYDALLNARSGVSNATIYSAFPIDDWQLPEVVEALERRFGRRLHASVVIDPALIGGIRAVVGDEVFDASVRARLDQMKAALID